jgi:CheY-like chemotaxis protein
MKNISRILSPDGYLKIIYFLSIFMLIDERICMGKLGNDSPNEMQKAQIDEWLRQADTHIRGGRYLAADELIQKVLDIQPQHSVAHSYQDRIQFLIKQLSQRVGMENDMYREIQKYRELLLKRKSGQIDSYLNSSHRYLDEGNFKQALEQANKALALDPGNVFAKELMQRIREVSSKPGITTSETQRENKFSAFIRECWQKGLPSEIEREQIRTMQTELNIPDGKCLELERTIKNTLYKQALQQIWVTGGLSSFTEEMVDTLRRQFDISRVDHSVIEAEFLKEFRKNRIKGNILIVDTDENYLIELSALLRMNFYAVIAASTLGEALASMKIVSPDIVITSVNPESGTPGFDLFEAIRKSTTNRYVPCIFTTSTNDRTTYLIGKRLGVDEFFLKPIDHELLLSTLDGKLRIHKKQAPLNKESDLLFAHSFRR